MSTKKQPPRLSASPSIADLRSAIDTAVADGIKRPGLILRLTHRDASRIKRSPDVAMDEVLFDGDQMWFLGVLTVTGSVTISTLERLDASERPAAAA